jgi:GT2 family glycosyltransferase
LAPLTISVVIVSRDRPGSLIRCLAGIDGLDYPAYEVVVVACPEGSAAIRRTDYDSRLKLIEYDKPNISAARNLAIAAAAGDIVAFIDDDAVPEPTWLRYLSAPFDDRSVAAVGGFVRGRNGISFQWKAREVDNGGVARPLMLDETRAMRPTPTPGWAIKTEGTNMAVRRKVLADLGGFDPGFRFYLDETDLNRRMNDAGLETAIAPLAQVHHAYAANAQRNANRAVTDLSEIGASTAYFLRRHCPEDSIGKRLNEMIQDQRLRVFDQLRAKKLRKSDLEPLMQSLKRGIEDGKSRDLAVLETIPPPNAEFLPFAPRRRGSVVIKGRIWQAKRLRRVARQQAAGGANVSLFLFGPSPRKHSVQFTDDGVWEQSGGIFGRSDRAGPLIQFTSFESRLNRERDRVAAIRGLDTK